VADDFFSVHSGLQEAVVAVGQTLAIARKETQKALVDIDGDAKVFARADATLDQKETFREMIQTSGLFPFKGRMIGMDVQCFACARLIENVVIPRTLTPIGIEVVRNVCADVEFPAPIIGIASLNDFLYQLVLFDFLYHLVSPFSTLQEIPA
jgi:hypothetical protein